MDVRTKIQDPRRSQALGPSRREQNRTRTRADIASAALTLFEAQGYRASTVEQVAQAAGCSSATFFRYFASKEDVLFAHDRAAVEELTRFVAARADKRMTLAALADPVAEFAKLFLSDTDHVTQRLTRLVMTTPELEARSMRMRRLWEHAVARQLGREDGEDTWSPPHLLLASLAVSCLASALWEWQQPDATPDLDLTTLHAFRRAQDLSSK